jgi:hypothetical protein
MLQTSRQIRRRRLKYAIPGFIVGFAGAAVARWVLGYGFAVFEAIAFGLGATSWALWYGEKHSALSTRDDLAVVRLREEMSPLGLKSESDVPVTLKTASEKNH